MSKEDGWPAFPVPSDFAFDGMSLRDYFAGQFMSRAQSLSEDHDGWDFMTAAQCAYAMADAMLAERAK